MKSNQKIINLNKTSFEQQQQTYVFVLKPVWVKFAMRKVITRTTDWKEKPWEKNFPAHSMKSQQGFTGNNQVIVGRKHATKECIQLTSII